MGDPAKLSFKEAVRFRSHWLLLDLLDLLPAVLVPTFQLLFAGNTKPSDEMRATTSLVIVVPDVPSSPWCRRR